MFRDIWIARDSRGYYLVTQTTTQDGTMRSEGFTRYTLAGARAQKARRQSPARHRLMEDTRGPQPADAEPSGYAPAADPQYLMYTENWGLGLDDARR